LYRHLNDSITAADKIESVNELAAQFQAERREAEIIQLSMQGELDQEKIKVSEQRMWLFGSGALILLVLVMFVWRSSLSRKKTNVELAKMNNEIHAKNEELDQKNQEITDSINYAKRFQTSILASENEMSQYFDSHAVLYKPKDIVSGDFYMLEVLPSGGAVLVVADCTGHGVPGAMVSLIGARYISRAIHEEHIDDPGKALGFLNKNMPKAFESDQVTINDGMDVSICHISDDKELLSFAGANNNCWILNQTESFIDRKGRKDHDLYFESDGIGLLELKGTRSGIGKSSTSTEFEGVSLPLKKGDRLVLTTDGYVDQFGGMDGKKFKKSQLRSLLIENFEESAIALKERLGESISQWMKGEEQVDDICLIVVDF
ncbi:MAG: SpoIIE family protein phosphatase, partial [Crocinitomicaceae bacterium]|nr:SpoIIE family protein phosphatase [Crocinitomicaceae bacterium]